MHAELNKEIQQWIRQGAHDLEMAEKNISFEGFDVSVTLSQQAAEKYLKAVFIMQFQKRPPKTHFLDELAHTLGLPESLRESAGILSSDYSASRYPDILGIAPVDAYDRQDAEDRLHRAKEIAKWCNGKLEK